MSVALVIEHAIRVRHVTLSLACPLVQYFPRYLIRGTNFERHVIEYKCVFGFSLQRMSDTFFTLRRVERNMIENV